MIARFFGALLVNVGIWFILLRETMDPVAVRGMLTGYLVGLVIGLINALTGVLAGPFNALGWLIVLLYGGLAAGAVYFLAARPVARTARTGA